MSKPVLPWSLKGVSPEAREIAKKAAAQQGITIGEWVSRAIRDVGPRPESDAASQVTPVSDATTADDAIDGEAVREAVRARIYDAEERVAHMVGPLQDIIERLSRRLTRIEERVETQIEDPPASHLEQPGSRRLDGW